jgi:hypothetical protein
LTTAVTKSQAIAWQCKLAGKEKSAFRSGLPDLQTRKKQFGKIVEGLGKKNVGIVNDYLECCTTT